MKKLLLLLLAFVYSFSLEFKQDFLEPEDAFKTSFTKNEDSLNFKLDLGDSIYLYDDKLQVFITKPQSINITKNISYFISFYYIFYVNITFYLKEFYE